MQQNEQERISQLICKHLVGTITDEEQAVLDQWRSRNVHNEAAYQRLLSLERLQVEYDRRRLTDYQRPLNEMKHRLGIGRPRWYRYAAAAIILLVIGVGSYWQWHRSSMEDDTSLVAQVDIRPGTTKAMLTMANGEVVTLSGDSRQPAKSRLTVNKQQRQSSLGEAKADLVLTTPRGGEFRVTLEDGTEVWLNAASRLVYPENFDGAERRVEIEGEAYFRVAKNAEKPFVVVSGTQEIKVYGTEFNVHAYSDEPFVSTTLVEGSISLRHTLSDGSELMLTPGHQAVLRRDETAARVQQIDTEVVTSWRSGTFVFENQTMEQIMRTLSRWYDFDYEFGDSKTAETVFMGSIPRYGSFTEVCDIFHRLGGIRLQQQGRKVLISAE